MIAIAQRWPKPDRRTLIRGVTAGSAWGITMATALLGLAFHQCGTICLGQIVETTAMSLAAGMLTIGPIALLRREA
ncbi:hypothetical protein [Pseudorhodoplanes sp.]|uniref:hypothetical protein n=1 Tax=Pseudorhodoplanes sp. TaxID=1934341 RepID=UPI002B7038EE|nr:hypothetical protein [Pseudorhodoplanes sp.]HWV51334.1 hypothetical protein [Pseudorhodoplanes sp.]